MARSNVFTTVAPTDLSLRSSVDDFFREDRLNIQEIANQFLGVAENTVLADPVVSVANSMAQIPALNALKTVQTFELVLPWSSFQWRQKLEDGEGGVAYLQDTLTIGSSSVAVGGDIGYAQISDPLSLGSIMSPVGYAPLVLPVGVTITELTAYLYRNAAAEQVALSLSSHVITSAAGSVTVATGSTSGATTGSIVASATIGTPVVLATNRHYQLVAAITGSANTTQCRFYGVKVTYTSPTANVRI